MELQEAKRVALACAIDTARALPRGKTRARVFEAIRVLNADLEFNGAQPRPMPNYLTGQD